MNEIKKPSAKMALLLSRSLLGTITLLGMIVGFDSTKESLPKLMLALLVTNVSLTLTRFHSEAITSHIHSGRRPNAKEKWQILTDSALVAIPSLIPVVILFMRWLGLIPEGMGLIIAKYTAVGMLFMIGYFSSRLVGGNYFRSTLTGFGDMTLGLIIVLLNYLF
jgi:VIT1/CCC1 family predicted Fe2+/Mn2+ transporter